MRLFAIFLMAVFFSVVPLPSLQGQVLNLIVPNEAQAAQYTATVDEPTTNENGSALDDLATIRFKWTEDGGPAQHSDVSASGPGGGGQATNVITVTDPPACTTKALDFWATALDTNLNESGESNHVQRLIDRRQESPCVTPSAPSNLGVNP